MERERKSATPALLIVATAMMLLALYVASIGPAYRLAAYGQISESSYWRLYFPVLYPCDAWPAYSDALDWYVSLWRPSSL